jgi:hypothetical protein
MDTPVAPGRGEKGRFISSEANKGRKVGATSRYTRIIKEAVLIAAELEGENQHGKGKLVGYMRRVAREDMRAFCMLLSRAMSLQGENRTDDAPKEVVYKSLDEVKREMASRGISMDLMFKMSKAMEADEDELDDGAISAGEDGILGILPP